MNNLKSPDKGKSEKAYFEIKNYVLELKSSPNEPLSELNRFIEAMVKIRDEIRHIEEGKVDKANNVLKNAPHTICMATNDEWDLPYSREKAAFPVKFEIVDKYWPPVTRIDDAYGDRNLVCSCVPIDDYKNL